MPTPTRILDQLQASANALWWLAVLWHLALACVVVALTVGYRPTRRTAALALAFPLVSASLVAWDARDAFNGGALALIAAALGALGARTSGQREVEPGARWSSIGGALVVLFAALYPHFVEPADPMAYAVVAPLGVLPCPSLALVVGFTLMADGFGSRPYALLAGGAGLFYGAFGALRLNVWIDLALVAGSIALLARAIEGTGGRESPRRWASSH